MTGIAIDFLKRPHTSPLAWGVLFAGVLCLIAALWMQRLWTVERAQWEHDAQAEAERRRIHERPAAPPKLTAAQIRWQQAQNALRSPWLPVLRSVESATTDPVYLLSLSVDSVTGSLKLEAEAPSFDHAVAYMQLLDEDGALAPAMLLSHEQAVEAGSGRFFVRFVVATHWNIP